VSAVTQSLLDRIRGEYREMPGMRLNLQQACRLWQLAPQTCEQLLTTLVAEGFLIQSEDGSFLRLPSARRW
jgi:DNA-binding IclR family transcriptional regulator